MIINLQNRFEMMLVYDDENLINAYSRFEFAINADTNQLYSRHIILGRVREWKEYTTN